MKVVTKGKIFFDVLGLFCKAVLSDSKRNSARIVLTSSQGSSFYKASYEFFNECLTEKLSGMHDTCTSIADKVILDKEISKRRTIRVYDLQCEKKTVVQVILII